VESTKEQFYQRRIAELEAENSELRRENAKLVAQNVELLTQVAKLTAQVEKLTEQVVRLSKNSSNSSKPPSSDIVKPPKPNNTKGPRRQGGQPGHHGVNRSAFRADQIDHTEERHPTACPHCCDGKLKRLFHVWHLRDKIPKERFDRIMFRIRDRVLRLAEVHDAGERSKSRTLARRFGKHGDDMFRFLFDSAVPPTNNAAEQTIRQAVIDRRITQSSRSVMGREWNARIWTVLATCKKQGRSSWQFLQNALSAHYFQTPTPSLLPQTN